MSTSHRIAAILSVRKRRMSLQREADILEQEEKGLIGNLIDDMSRKGIQVLKEGEDEAVMVVTDEPSVDNWPDFLDYIIENEAVDLLQKRVTPNAVKARWAEGEVVPGVSSVTKYALKFNI